MQNTTATPEASDSADLHASGPDHTGHGQKQGVALLALGAIGVVYGDIGTSPLYAMREAVRAGAGEGGAISPEAVLGALSLIIWSLFLVVTLKYVVILLNADNRGEGGTLSLMALAQRGRGKFIKAIPVLGMIGAGLFYGDGIITPAVSVIGAVEGLEIVSPAFASYVVWLTIAIIIVLFAVQSHGTARVAAFFGPVTLLWFMVLGVTGAMHLAANWSVLQGFNPLLGLHYLTSHGAAGLVVLGAVFLAVTGAEALYADLGHFGKAPIRLAWIAVVLPCLLLNYLGQASLIINEPATIENPFFHMVPAWGLIPLVAIATAAAIIASQAVITGAYSLTRQAIQLGIMPRMQINFTSESNAGQIYLPQINWLLMVGVIVLVLAFQSSSSLATAYGISVTGTMVVTTILAMFVMANRWRWPLMAVLAVLGPLLAIDGLFLFANALKIVEGGWVPLAIAAAVITLMWTWRRGTRFVRAASGKMETPLTSLVSSLEKSRVHRIQGTAVFFTTEPENAPSALLHSLKHYQVLHKQNIILTIRGTDTPYAAKAERMRVREIGPDFTGVILKFGFMETPNVPKALAESGLKLEAMRTTYFLSRRNLQPSEHGGMPLWQDKLFIMMARNANDASTYFQLPTDRVVEVGSRIVI
jgi:KUP system potassium uptake protein